jgi:hypothetical protein
VKQPKLIATSEIPHALAILYPDKDSLILDERMWGQKLIAALRRGELHTRNQIGMGIQYSDESIVGGFIDVAEVAEWLMGLGCYGNVTPIFAKAFISLTHSNLGDYGQYHITENGVAAKDMGDLSDCPSEEAVTLLEFKQNANLDFPATPQKLVEWVVEQSGEFDLPEGFVALATMEAATDLRNRQIPSSPDADDDEAEVGEIVNPADAKPRIFEHQVTKTTKQDTLAVELDQMLQAMRQNGERIVATVVFSKLKKNNGNGGCVVDVTGDGSYLIWESASGQPKEIGLSGLQKRIDRWKNPPDKPPINPR